MATARPHVRRTQAERSETTQRRIVESATRIILKDGFQKANLTNIAHGAKVTLGALQHHFGNRQTLIERVVSDVMAPLGDHGAVWPPADMPLNRRAVQFVELVWKHIYGHPSYVAAWALFFGCKSTPALFKLIDRKRAEDDPQTFEHFLLVFPEVRSNHPEPDGFAGFVFAALRGIAVFNLFPISASTVQTQLGCLAEQIASAGATKKLKRLSGG